MNDDARYMAPLHLAARLILENGGEIAKIYSLKDAFDVILSKLDNVDAAKTRRYRFVYAKLLDFEKYLQFLGTDVALDGSGIPAPHMDPALMDPNQLVEALRRKGGKPGRAGHQLGLAAPCLQGHLAGGRGLRRLRYV